MFSCEIYTIIKNIFCYRTAPVADSEIQFVLSKDSRTNPSVTVSNNYQIQLKKCICCTENQHLSDKFIEVR